MQKKQNAERAGENKMSRRRKYALACFLFPLISILLISCRQAPGMGEETLQTEQRIVFSGNATEAIGMFPTKVNVAVAASLASVGPENMQVSIQSTPGFVGDTQKVEIKNDQVHAVVEVYSATSDIAGWSVVNTLINILTDWQALSCSGGQTPGECGLLIPAYNAHADD